MSNATLYTFGYLTGRAERTLQELIALKTPIVDVRFSPDARQYQWTKEALESRAGIIYYWIRDLGNENYKSALTGKFQELRIKIHDKATGLIELSAILDEHGHAALMCACSSKKTCHRIEVASLAKERLGVQVIHL
jgi:uncharacterized protein (DUF488 family)